MKMTSTNYELDSKYLKALSHTPKIMKRDPPPNDKGKGKALKPKMIEDEHYPLHKRWCIE